MNTGGAPSAARRSHGRGRVASIDLARGVAVVLMVAAHASDAFLADTWRHNDIWYRVDLLFGFVAPAFAFLSGVTLFMALRGRADAPRGEQRGRFGPIVRRLLGVLLLGYWLQLPNLSLRQLVYAPRADELARLFDANILQVIAISGLLAVGLVRALGSIGRARVAALVAGAGGIVATPYLWASGVGASLPLPIRFYLTPQPPATFALLPTLAYFMLGFGLAAALVAAGRSWRGIAILLGAGGTLAAAGLLLDTPLHPYPPHNDFWWSSAQHVLFRTGGLLILMSLSSALARLIGGRDMVLALAGRKSLPIYILHLMLFYGSPVTMGMRAWFDGAFARTLGPLTVVAIVGATLACCLLALNGWDWLARHHPRWSRRLAWSAWGAFAAVFLLKP